MKIDTFDIELFSSRSYSETREQQVSGMFKFGDLVNQNMERNMNQSMEGGQIGQDRVQTNSEQAVSRADEWYRPVLFEGQPALTLTEKFKAEMDKMKQMLDAIMDSFSNMNVIRHSAGCCFTLSRISQVSGNSFSGNFAQSPVQLSAYEYSETTRYTYSESEQTRFTADGIVNTLDGNELNFSFEMNMARSFFREESFAWTETGYALIDPLIVNAGVTTPQFSGIGFSFDMDMDGSPESILAPEVGTGFLSLDKNKDGVINDGSELFGPSTGDGFKELAAYDLDQNSWIDENDAVFDELTLYGLDESGEMQLTRIKDAGMGAIYLAGVDTNFDVKNGDNELQARIKKTSVALNEDGSVSSVQEADWTV